MNSIMCKKIEIDLPFAFKVAFSVVFNIKKYYNK